MRSTTTSVQAIQFIKTDVNSPSRLYKEIKDIIFSFNGES